MTTSLKQNSTLLEPLRAGAFSLPHRILMAPLTRNRADRDGTPNELQATYYAQRAQAGLVISEGSQPSAVGQGYPNTPGVHTDAQQNGWARIVRSVRDEGGQFVVQLMHAGRISHVDTTGTQPVAPSAVRAAGQIFTESGMQAHSDPRALDTDEIASVIAEFVDAARRSVAAGADGVELHAANGYLLHQFLADGVNQRTDRYGGDPENRARFVLDTARAVANEIGADRVGVRVSPGHPFNDVSETDLSVYDVLATGLGEIGIAYLHVLCEADDPVLAKLRGAFPGVLVFNSGFGADSDPHELEQLVKDGRVDAVAVGRKFLANPDLVDRWTQGAELNEPDQSTFYGGDHRGYTDYPKLTE
ncbi:alkene reductase [Allosaccharopolyspora coralli]|uniref:Alkene reductase n=1 Tax=Allosaccharopolyspora coralli TaxID=2665642 RepID=A0A5Q3QA73_9PSEU|nr:alkene reductase [Allosaccharopolyspora coralli]QGK70760.1 alkene reductase [Allosaccharopolyspora coralli]